MRDDAKGCTIWFTGLSGSGKTTCSKLVSKMLQERRLRTELMDGDVIRTNLSKGLGFSRQDRETNIRRIGFVCDLLTRNGVFVCAAAISPYKDTRQEVRKSIGRFVMVHCDAPLHVLEERDVKGLYKKARAGLIKHFTGIDDPYEAPQNPEVVVHSDGRETPGQSAAKVIRTLELLGYIEELPGLDLEQWAEEEIREMIAGRSIG
ncbi:MAG: adenylyl-sulfate kinase [Deltaproteobacteria bacterium]|nr:adenylyl-sulfate kinase [Deltaproteobacteria bacterium]